MINSNQYRFSVLKQLSPFAVGIRHMLLVNLLLGLFGMVLGFIQPLFYKIFIDNVILGSQSSLIGFVIAGYFFIFILNVGIGYAYNYFNYIVECHTLLNIKNKILDHFFNLPFHKYEKTETGDWKMNLENDTEQVKKFAGSQSIDYAVQVMTLLCSLILILLIDWRLAVFSLLSIPITTWADQKLAKQESILNNENRVNDQQMHTWLYSAIPGWREIKALNLVKSQERQYVKYLNSFAKYYSRWINYWTARILVVPRIKDDFFMRFGLYFLGGLLIMNDELKISELLIFVTYYDYLSNAIRTVSAANAELQANRPIIDRMLNLISADDDTNDAGNTIPVQPPMISMCNVGFKYPDSETPVLHNFNLSILPGEKVAIVGKSGCGKTTLLKLVTGLLSPTCGEIRFADININEINSDEMLKRIGYVMQENHLFNTTIRENLLYGKADASDAEILDACERAQISLFIQTLPNGLDTIIGENGIKLSGGQRQRIVLARIFLRNCDVLIFDEATNALDQWNESMIQETIQTIAKDKTVIVVSHQASSIRYCDKIIYMTDLREIQDDEVLS